MLFAWRHKRFVSIISFLLFLFIQLLSLSISFIVIYSQCVIYYLCFLHESIYFYISFEFLYYLSFMIPLLLLFSGIIVNLYAIDKWDTVTWSDDEWYRKVNRISSELIFDKTQITNKMELIYYDDLNW